MEETPTAAGVLEPVLPNEVFDWTAPTDVPPPEARGRFVTVAPGAVLEFKAQDEAAACNIGVSTQPPNLTVDARRCTRPVRLNLRLSRLAGFLQTLGPGAATVDVRAPMRPLDFDPAQIEWIALLTETRSGERVFWKRLNNSTRLAAPHVVKGTALCSWSELEDAVDLFLAIQLAPGSPTLRLDRLAVSVSNASTVRGRLLLAGEQLQGWFGGGRDVRAAVRVATADGAARELTLEPERGQDEGRFTVPRAAVEAALQQAGAVKGQHAVELWLDDALAAKTRIAIDPPGEAAASKPAPGRFERLGAEALVARLKLVADAEEIGAGLAELYARREPEALWRLQAELAGGGGSAALRAYLRLFHSRSMLDMNAAETAYAGLHALLDDPELSRALLGPDRTRARKLLARACVRSGRVPEAADIQHALTADTPTDWEPWYQLGVLQSAAQPERRRFFHAAAESLAERLPAPAVSYIAEAWLEEGRADEAVARVLPELRRNPDAAELYLNLCNVHLRMEHAQAWRRSLAAYFAHHGLSPPPFAPGGGTGLFGEPLATAPTSGPDGPLVTVVMTCFNAEATIEAAARSVLAQTHRNLRLVIVDDVSTDGSRAAIERLREADPRVEALTNTENVGTYCAKNSALRAFRSEFYAFHDSDDWMHPDRISEHLKVMAGRPETVFCSSMWIRMEAAGRVVIRRVGGFLHENPASAFFRAELLEEVGYFDSVRTGADSEFAWRVRRRYGAKATVDIRKPLAVGLHHGGSLTQSGAAAFDDHRHSPVRLTYWESWIRWHEHAVLTNSLERLRMPFPLGDRLFEAPPEILPQRLAT